MLSNMDLRIKGKISPNISTSLNVQVNVQLQHVLIIKTLCFLSHYQWFTIYATKFGYLSLRLLHHHNIWYAYIFSYLKDQSEDHAESKKRKVSTFKIPSTSTPGKPGVIVTPLVSEISGASSERYCYICWHYSFIENIITLQKYYMDFWSCLMV